MRTGGERIQQQNNILARLGIFGSRQPLSVMCVMDAEEHHRASRRRKRGENANWCDFGIEDVVSRPIFDFFFVKMRSAPFWLLLLFAYQYTAAWPSFRLRLPNGERVPCPSDVPGCDANTPFCKGVGHTTCAGCAFRSACSNCFASPIFCRSRSTKR